ncbi:MAG TPA: DNA polymerase III subunit gamma/tau [Methylococcaceae bacterium]|nr:DNA polymerase III subunit gamma/tau [Methylococcaceae bacterium]
MTYQALARKWRPRTFGEVVGQDHVIRALSHALEHDRTHHAYLFTGTRGVGKTTLARIFAKALNCAAGMSAHPCGQCSPCREVDSGTFVDLLELDAASNTGIDNMRDVLENAQYAPVSGRYKVYLIDEVHMLSRSAFNSMLKTLEEPPAHVKFLLATTDPQKIPVTVLSRCLQFNLKRMRPEQIRDQMAAVLDREGVAYEAPALRALARAADGSMRDGLSLLDQAIAHGAGAVREEQVAAMLGSVPRQPVFDLLRALAHNDGAALLQLAAALHEQAADFAEALNELTRILHRLVLLHVVPTLAADDEEGPALRELAQNIAPEDLQLFYQIALNGRRDLPLAPDPRGGFEMTLLRMLAFRPGDAPPPPAPPRPTAARSPNPPAAAREAPPPTASAAPDWSHVIPQLELGGMARQLAAHCELRALDESNCALVLSPEMAHLRTPRLEEALENALQKFYGRPLKLVLKMEHPSQETPASRMARQREEKVRAAEESLLHDPALRAFQELLDARIEPGSTRPIDE